MADPFVAEIRIFPFNFAPVGWAFCDGQLMPLSQNTALFSLLGTQYGGDGKSTFALPDLMGASPLGQGQGPGLSLRDVGESGGAELSPIGTPNATGYRIDGSGNYMAIGGDALVRTRPPSLTLMFCIALQGIFPARW